MNKDQFVNQIIRQTQSRMNHHLIDARNQFYSPKKHSQHFHTLSQNKHRANVIKINKAKLPHDFFPKPKNFDKKLPNLKVQLKQGSRCLPTERHRRAESERLHYSPEKVSLYGLFDPEPFSPCKLMPKTVPIKRKFESREELKRDLVEMKRLFTPGTSFYRVQVEGILGGPFEGLQRVTSISSKKMIKSSPRKQHQVSPRKGQQMKIQQLVHDPQKYDRSSCYQPCSLISLRSTEQPSQMRKIQQKSRVFRESIDLHNMTFFNLKSSCLPPIRKA